ncbi:hypothetical protein D3C78_1800540 [compost metagenome]
MSVQDAPAHPHLQARGTFVDVGGVVQPAPAPRFSRSVPPPPRAPQASSAETAMQALRDWIGEDEALQWQPLVSRCARPV